MFEFRRDLVSRNEFKIKQEYFIIGVPTNSEVKLTWT
jgi:hypothetical protein